jgi:hypothetical protein
VYSLFEKPHWFRFFSFSELVSKVIKFGQFFCLTADFWVSPPGVSAKDQAQRKGAAPAVSQLAMKRGKALHKGRTVIDERSYSLDGLTPRRTDFTASSHHKAQRQKSTRPLQHPSPPGRARDALERKSRNIAEVPNRDVDAPRHAGRRTSRLPLRRSSCPHFPGVAGLIRSARAQWGLTRKDVWFSPPSPVPRASPPAPIYRRLGR